ncbi:MAG: site-specific DNA-methyltransferase [Chloroflexi bacterium]|nr:site-specific DNA-methyltransferase [Chloroflexota bacterium]
MALSAKDLRITTLDKDAGILNRIKNYLGEPYYENEFGLIYNIDCLIAMQSLPNELINQTFTSPPYNIGKEYEIVMPLKKYINWCKRWIDEVYRITKQHGSFWLNVGYLQISNKGKFVPITYFLWNISDFFLQQEIVWNYGAGVAAKQFLSPRNEKILWFLKDQDNYIFNLDDIRDKDVKYPAQKKKGKLRCNTIGKNPSDVWQIAKVTSGQNRSSSERVNHPAQTPRDLLDRVILAGSNKEDLILDPFLGSGSTFESAIANNRKFIGFEIRQDYCAIAKLRIKNFIEREKAKNAQLSLL